MPSPTEDQKQRFLEYIRLGDDRATAAWRIDPEFTGSMFRSMCNPHSPKNYDPDFAAAYDQACSDRGPLDPDRQQIWSGERESRPTTSQGYTKAMHLSEDQLDEFLDLVQDGMQAAAAAKALDPPTSITQINRRAAKDKEFADEFRQAKEEGYASYRDNLRAEWARQAFAGDYRALRDQLIVHLDDVRPILTTQKHELGGPDGGAIRLFAEKFPDLPPEMLDQMIQSLEKREFGQLEAGNTDGG